MWVRSGLLTMRTSNAFPNDLSEFPVDNQSGINKPLGLIMSSTRKPM